MLRSFAPRAGGARRTSGPGPAWCSLSCVAPEAEVREVGPEPTRLPAERLRRLREPLRRVLVRARPRVDLLQERDRAPARLALLAEGRVDPIHHVAHRLHAVPDACRAPRLLLGGALRLVRDLAH